MKTVNDFKEFCGDYWTKWRKFQLYFRPLLPIVCLSFIFYMLSLTFLNNFIVCILLYLILLFFNYVDGVNGYNYWFTMKKNIFLTDFGDDLYVLKEVKDTNVYLVASDLCSAEYDELCSDGFVERKKIENSLSLEVVFKTKEFSHIYTGKYRLQIYKRVMNIELNKYLFDGEHEGRCRYVFTEL